MGTLFCRVTLKGGLIVPEYTKQKGAVLPAAPCKQKSVVFIKDGRGIVHK